MTGTDQRIPLQMNTVLEVTNREAGSISYVIQKEIGRGRSCLVYEAVYRNNSGMPRRVRIKECYPMGIPLAREADGRLVESCDRDQVGKQDPEVLGNQGTEGQFPTEKSLFKNAFQINNLLADEAALTNTTTNTIDIYEKNNTVYIVTSYVEGYELTYDSCRSLKSALRVTKTIAEVLRRIHERGYLYLDLKPSNVWVYQETEELIQLFDFDSPILQSQLESADKFQLLWSKGSAPTELRKGNTKQIGPWTDCFELGAVFYFLLFGTFPGADQCDMGAVFAYEKSIVKLMDYPDRMVKMLDEFFHRALAGYYKDRFQTMQEMENALEQLISQADPAPVFLHKRPVQEPVCLIGRGDELEALSSWWEKANARILLVTGMGGIGKSTLVRKFAANRQGETENLLILSADKGISESIVDDLQVPVHGISRMQEETEEDYFERKLGVLKELGLSSEKNLLVIDNFEGELTEDYEKLLDLGWKTIIISRESRYKDFFAQLPVGALKNEELENLFSRYMQRRVEASERVYFRRICDAVWNHTLALELLGRQIAMGNLTIEDAAKMAERYGFSGVTEERVDFARDLHFQYDSIRGIIRALFEKNALSKSEKCILKLVGICAPEAMYREEFPFFSEKGQRELELLQEYGWIHLEEHRVSMHPVILEVVQGWGWNRQEILLAEQYMDQLKAEMKSAGDLKGEPEGTARMLSLLRRSEYLLNNAEKMEAFASRISFMQLLVETASRTPRDREVFILHAGELLSRNQEKNQKNYMTAAGCRANRTIDSRACMAVYDMVLTVLLQQNRLDEAEKLLKKCKQLAGADEYLRSMYYSMLGFFYDELLDGEYEKEAENPYLNKFLKAHDNQEKYLKKYLKRTEDAKVRDKLIGVLSESLLLKIRCNLVTKKEIQNLILEMKELIRPVKGKDTEAEYAFLVALGWYYTYEDLQPDRVDALVKKAAAIAEKIYLSDLDLINFVYIPYANMKLECRVSGVEQLEIAAEYLRQAMEICDRYPEVACYVRKKEMLEGYLEEIFEFQDNKM